MKKLSTLILILIISIPSFAQPGKPDSLSQLNLKSLAFMAGEWKGSGWRYSADRQKHTFTQTEKVQFKLDSTVLMIEGQGKSMGKTIHNALAIINYNAEEDNFKFTSFLSDGRGGEFKGEMKEGKFYWYPNDFIRYIIYLNEKGQWYEIGEMNRDGQWIQFFEMTLNKS